MRHFLFKMVLCIPLLSAAAGCDRSSPAGATPPGSDAGRRAKPAARHKKVLVLGCDGMDPRLVRRLIDAGRMPTFARLEKAGGFRTLETSIPPQSPVAWSNFITGANPGVHGIYDFVHRNLEPSHPTLNVTARTSTSIDTPPSPPLFDLPVGGYDFTSRDLNPFASGGETKLTRAGSPFWDFLDERGIPVQIYKIAANYPPSPSHHGHMCCLAGMGVPDAMATMGTYQHFSSEPRASREVQGGRREMMTKDFKNGGYIATLKGPHNEYRPVNPRTGERPPMEVDLRIYPDPVNPCVKIQWVNQGVAANETKEVILNRGEWSEWQEVHFLQTPVGPSLPTMVRFYLQEMRRLEDRNDIRLYVSPLNFIPTNSAAVISEPPEFVKEIGEGMGPFHTQGFAETFNARKNGDVTDEEYLAQANIVMDESMKMLDYALDRYVDGLLFFYFSSTDLQAHIFWWDSDDPHPFRTPEDAAKYHAVIETVYEKMDAALARCMEALGDDATYIVMSDHGFGNFRRQFGLNSWLRENGYLATERDEVDLFRSSKTDWSKTRAYGLGINGLYVNLKGRERLGVVDPKDRAALLDELTAKLLAYEDPDEPGRHPIRTVYRSDVVYKGSKVAEAPDLIIGYERDYRASWNTGTGYLERGPVVSDNRKPWSADHCVAHDLVPGVLLSNRPIADASPALIDMAPTILAEFGIATPDTMDGRPIFGRTPAAGQ